MKRLLLAIMALGVTLGCTPEALVTSTEAKPDDSTTAVAPPISLEAGSLFLENDGVKLHVGDRITKVMQAFSKPAAYFDFTDLPQRFQPPYRAEGWDTAREGLGIILYDDRVVAIMHQLRHSDDDHFEKSIDAIQTSLGPLLQPTVIKIPPESPRVIYNFWQEGSQRIMVCGLVEKRNEMEITVSLGENTVLNSLGMSPSQARSDGAEADRLLKATKN